MRSHHFGVVFVARDLLAAHQAQCALRGPAAERRASFGSLAQAVDAKN